MRLSNFEKKTVDGLTRVSVHAAWEDCDQPQREIFIETEDRFADDIEPLPDAFMVGALIPALHMGERRLALDGPVCPRLKEGLNMVMRLMQVWTEGRMQPLALEADTMARPRYSAGNRRSGLFLSGGVDSLAALRLNRLHYSVGHPGAVQDCLLVHGFDIGGVMSRGMKYHVFERARKHMAPVAMDAGVSLIPVYTNIRHLSDERDLWLNQFFGAVLGAVAQSFAPRLSRIEIAASYDLTNLVPCGSHPMLDPEYSSFDVQIRHRDVELSRVEKLRLMADWDVALQNLRVCLANTADRLNCGRCEKCVRTMTGLLAINALHKTTAFEENDVTPDLFDTFRINIRHRESFYEELLEPLENLGRQDLVDLIRKKFRE